MALPIALHSRVRVWVNGIEQVEATDVDIQRPRPVGQKFGAAGLIGPYKGQAGSRINFTFAQVEGKSQFETFVSTLQDFVVVWTKGTSKFMALNCELGDTGMRNTYESGDTSITVSIIGGEVKQVA